MRTIAVLLTLGVLVLAAPAAGMGRPSSAVIVAPETGASAVLHWHEVEYAELSSLVKAGTEAAVSARPPESAQLGASVMISWLAEDNDVWRVDRIYYATPGRPWIRTEVPTSAPGADARPAWHRSRDSDRLLQVLRDLRVIDVAYVGREVRSAETSATAEPRGRSGVAASNRWRWGGVGLLAGVLLTLAISWLVRSSSRHDRPPHQQLIDL